jgi:hypothetical protein
MIRSGGGEGGEIIDLFSMRRNRRGSNYTKIAGANAALSTKYLPFYGFVGALYNVLYIHLWSWNDTFFFEKSVLRRDVEKAPNNLFFGFLLHFSPMNGISILLYM